MIIQETDSVVFCSEQKQAWTNSEGQRHRKGGPAIIESDGSQEWYVEGERHREDGPALIEVYGRKVWYRKSLRHRIGGPSVIFPDGYQVWYVNGKQATQEEAER